MGKLKATLRGTPVRMLDTKEGTGHHLDVCLNVNGRGPGVSLDRTMRALADPTRREILRVLRDGDMTAGEIAALFPMTGASISHHLGVLKEAGLVQAERDGRHIVYSLDATVFQRALEEVMGYFEIGGPP